MAKDSAQIVEELDDLGRASGGLVVFTTIAASGQPHSSVVNAGVLPHPVTKEPVVALVVIGGARKLLHLEHDPRAVAVFRDGPRWTAVEGDTVLIGPDHPHPDVPADAVPALLRAIYSAAGGGEHPDWDEYDRTMAAERRVAVLMGIRRGYGVYWRKES